MKKGIYQGWNLYPEGLERLKKFLLEECDDEEWESIRKDFSKHRFKFNSKEEITDDNLIKAVDSFLNYQNEHADGYGTSPDWLEEFLEADGDPYID